MGRRHRGRRREAAPLRSGRPASGRQAGRLHDSPRTESEGPLAEAYWIKAALAAKAAGAAAGDAAAVDTMHATDQDGEVARLVRVAAAYRTISGERARSVLDSLEKTA